MYFSFRFIEKIRLAYKYFIHKKIEIYSYLYAPVHNAHTSICIFANSLNSILFLSFYVQNLLISFFLENCSTKLQLIPIPIKQKNNFSSKNRSSMDYACFSCEIISKHIHFIWFPSLNIDIFWYTTNIPKKAIKNQFSTKFRIHEQKYCITKF